MRNRMYGGVRGRKTKVGEKLLRFPPTRLSAVLADDSGLITQQITINVPKAGTLSSLG